MAKINNKKKYKITPVTAEDLLLGTQLATGKTSNFQVEDLVGIVQERIDEDSIQNIEFRGEDLQIIDNTVVLPSKLSQFENDLYPSGEGGKIDNVSFKGEDLPVNFNTNYSQNTAFGEASLVKKGNEVFYKMFANKSTNVEVGDTIFTLQPELRSKSPEFIVGHGGNGATAVWLMIEPTTGAVKVQEFPTEGSVTTMNAIVISGSFFIRE